MKQSWALLAFCLPLAEGFAPAIPGKARGGHGIALGNTQAFLGRAGQGFPGAVAGGTFAVRMAVDDGFSLSGLAAEKLPAYTKLGRVTVNGVAANLLVGPIFAIACFGWAAALYPAIALCYLYSRAFDAKRRR